jgi:hypothetical protein
MNGLTNKVKLLMKDRAITGRHAGTVFQIAGNKKICYNKDGQGGMCAIPFAKEEAKCVKRILADI